MRKYIVLSVNDNVDYLYYVPLTVWAWRHFGWEPILFYQGGNSDAVNLVTNNSKGLNWRQIIWHEGYRSDTITQISRLYAGCVLDPEDYLMTGDIDMIPLSDYWKPDTSKVTVYGHDLTGFGHFPICYIGMLADSWRKVMNLNTCDYNKLIKRDLDTLPQAKDPDFYKYWFTDQDLITARLKEYGTDKIDFIYRGQYANGFAVGRVDRGCWELNHHTLIDAHLMQQTWQSEEKIKKLLELLHHAFPKEDFLWWAKYTNEFRKLAV